MQQTWFGWKPARTVFEGRLIPVGTWQYVWTVPEDVSEEEYEAGRCERCGKREADPFCSDRKYALWLSGEIRSPDAEGSSGYANLTEWFSISDGSDDIVVGLHEAL